MINQISFPPALRRQVRDLIAIGGRITRDGITVLVDGLPEMAGALRTETQQLAAYIVPAVAPDDAALVRSLLTDAGTSVVYVTDPAAAPEVMMIALTRLDNALRDEPAQLIATVHDEVVLLVPDDLAAVERIGTLAQQEMVAAFVEVFPEAPTLGLVDPMVGPTWGDLKPLKVWLGERRPV
jgi:hypothetical protein